jgi:hypothetical protein
MRFHPLESSAWQHVMAALPRRKISAIQLRWKRLHQTKIDDGEDKTEPPEPHEDFEVPKVARPREPMTPFVGSPNPTYQSQPGGPEAETEFAPSMALE